jgi:protein-disulfide isomerase
MPASTDAEQAETLVAWFEANAARDGISSTPSFVIDGRTYSNMNFAEFQSIIDEKLN